jgi:hypothetical protein
MKVDVSVAVSVQRVDVVSPLELDDEVVDAVDVVDVVVVALEELLLLVGEPGLGHSRS